jgi:hypothetical protein
MAPQPIVGILLAAGLDWLEGLLPLVFVVIWVVSQVLNLFRGARPNPRAQRPPRPVRRAPRPAPRAAGGELDAEGTLDREIEAFLRRTLQRGESTAGEEPDDPPRPKRTDSKPSRRRSRTPEEAVASRPVSHSRPTVAGGDIASHVALAFAHDLAHDSPSTSSLPAVPDEATPAAALAAALHTPGGLRQLVLMREVLDRPVHRW